MDNLESTSKLIQQAQQGNAEALSVLYQNHVGQIYRYIAYRVNNDADAEDLTADVFVKMVEGLPTYEDRGVPFEAWLYRIASSRLIDLRRQQNRRPVEKLDERLSSDVPQPEQQMLEEAEHAELRQAVMQLNETDRQILVLRFVERKSHNEVAEIIGKSMTAVKAAQHRALIRLADLLGKDKVRHYFRGDRE